MTHTVGSTEGLHEPQSGAADTWFDQQYAFYPETATLADIRASEVCSSLQKWISEEGESAAEHGALSELQQGAKRIIFLFTNPYDLHDAVSNGSLADFIMTTFEELGTGDVSMIADSVRVRAEKLANARLYLAEKLEFWEGYTQDEQFWQALGVSHLLEEVQGLTTYSPPF